MLERISRRLVQVVQVSFSPTKCSSARFLLVCLGGYTGHAWEKCSSTLHGKVILAAMPTNACRWKLHCAFQEFTTLAIESETLCLRTLLSIYM